LHLQIVIFYQKTTAPGVDGRIILTWTFRKKYVGGMEWIELAQDRDRWRALVNAVMNLRVPKNAGNFLTRYKPVSFSKGLCSVE
jgi:CRISPR/Cas system-associated protein Cas7 (RAMP superfamily)